MHCSILEEVSRVVGPLPDLPRTQDILSACKPPLSRAARCAGLNGSRYKKFNAQMLVAGRPKRSPKSPCLLVSAISKPFSRPPSFYAATKWP